MKIKLKSETVWFNVMPTIGEGGRPLPTVDVTIEPGEVLPDGEYQLEVCLTGPKGKKRRATARLVVEHIS